MAVGSEVACRMGAHRVVGNAGDIYIHTMNRPVRSSDCTCAENDVEGKTKAYHHRVDPYAQCKPLVLFKINRNSEQCKDAYMQCIII